MRIRYGPDKPGERARERGHGGGGESAAAAVGMTPLCPAASVIEGKPVLARLTPTSSVILLRLPDGALVAYRNICPHMGIELDWESRRLLTRDGRYLSCTGHGALFDPRDGMCIRGPCAGEALTPLPVRIESKTVVLDA